MATTDTHVHLDDEAFAGDVEAVIARAAAAGVTRLVTIGTNLSSSRQAVQLAERFPEIWASVGVHPHDAVHCLASLEQDLMDLARHPRVVAIGETGLDFFRLHAPAAEQRAVFQRQITLAQRLDLPLVIHSREANDEVLQALTAAGATRVVMHCFSGDRLLARRCIEQGWFLAFGGATTYPRNAETRAVVADIPASRILFETDAPYLAPVPYRGHRNEPAWLTATIALCAKVRDIAPETLAEQADRNAACAFSRLAS